MPHANDRWPTRPMGRYLKAPFVAYSAPRPSPDWGPNIGRLPRPPSPARQTFVFSAWAISLVLLVRSIERVPGSMWVRHRGSFRYLLLQ
ncbi:hypothetical protein GQ53DRAFT_754665 [Thozetella sp. PMI_491]|nr:hypothetical protein GQ53DRAFT_754665 [Thozetella sp. PMI_491]